MNVILCDMKRIAFYSWQSDLPNSTNRGFIEKALENAVKKIRADDTIEVEPVIDRDTSGVPGSPDIASTILAKIDQADIFVCDVSIINKGKQSRPTPNPNVLIELGYAIKRLGWGRIIMVMNTAFGEPEMLPFDLRMKRVIPYKADKDGDSRTEERKKLETSLEQGLRTIMIELDKLVVADDVASISTGDQAISAVENSQPNQITLVRKFLSEMMDELDRISPPLAVETDVELDELLVQAIDQTEGLVDQFAHLASAIAISGNLQAAQAIYKNFEEFLRRYTPPPGFTGKWNSVRFDFYKFLGHELFVSLIAPLVQENKWEVMGDLLTDGLYIENSNRGTTGFVTFGKVSDYVELLERRRQRLKLDRVSLRADILNARHTNEALAKIMPMRQFVDADYFLFLRAGWDWRPWSVIYMDDQPPRFLVEAVRIKYAEQVLHPLSLPDIAALRARVLESKSQLPTLFRRSAWYFPLSDFNPDRIGSQ